MGICFCKADVPRHHRPASDQLLSPTFHSIQEFELPPDPPPPPAPAIRRAPRPLQIDPKLCFLRGYHFDELGGQRRSATVAGEPLDILLLAVSRGGALLRGQHFLSQLAHVSVEGDVPLVPSYEYVLENTDEMRAALNSALQGRRRRRQPRHYRNDDQEEEEEEEEEEEHQLEVEAAAPIEQTATALRIRFLPRRLGTFRCRFYWRRPTDNRQVELFIGRQISFQVLPGHPVVALSHVCLCSPSSPVVPPSDAVAEYSIQLRDQLGNPWTSADSTMVAFVQGALSFAPSHAEMCQASFHFKKGSFVCRVGFRKAGTLLFRVLLSGEPIPMREGERILPQLTLCCPEPQLWERFCMLQKTNQGILLKLKKVSSARIAFDNPIAHLHRNSLTITRSGVLGRISAFLGREQPFAVPLTAAAVVSLVADTQLELLPGLHQEPLQLFFDSENERLLFHCLFMTVVQPLGHSFEQKLQQLQRSLRRYFPDYCVPNPPSHRFTVDRQDVVTSLLQGQFPDDFWHRRWQVQFLGEQGLDYGGLLAELFVLLGAQLFRDPALFQPFDLSRPLQPFPSLDFDPTVRWHMVIPHGSAAEQAEREKLYFLAGQLTAKAIYDSRMFRAKSFIPVRFIQAFYKLALNCPVSFRDFESDDPTFFSNHVRLLTHNKLTREDAATYDLCWAVSSRTPQGATLRHPLKKNGADQFVDETSKLEYLDALAAARFCFREMEIFRKGMAAVLGEELMGILQLMSPQQLEILVAGSAVIDLDEWRAPGNMRYFTDESAEHRAIINWFWVCVQNMSHEEQSKLLLFITGSSQVPPGGFASYSPKIGIEINIHLSPTALPVAHTCFNVIDLPVYADYRTLDQQLRFAIQECSGFDLR